MVAEVAKELKPVDTNQANSNNNNSTTTSNGKPKDVKGKNQRRRKKSQKQRLAEEAAKRKAVSFAKVPSWVKEQCLTLLQEIENNKTETVDNVEIEYVTQTVDADTLKKLDGMDNVDDESLQQFSNVFKHFQIGGQEEVRFAYPVSSQWGGSLIYALFAFKQDDQVIADDVRIVNASEKDEENEEDEDEEKEGGEQTLSKKKLKKLQRLSVAELKQLVKKPEVVEVRFHESSCVVL